MKKRLSHFVSLICILGVLTSVIPIVSAHQGKTDSSGGHNDNKNKSGLGSYHYHCGGYPAHLHPGGYCPYTDVFPSSVQISAEKTTLRIGEKVAVSAAVSPSNACNTNVTWECSDTNVIKLNNGMMEAVGYGTAVITATSFNEKVAQATITVKEVTAEQVTVTDVENEDGASGAIFIGEERQLSAAITPEDVDDPSITWASSDLTIATVDSSGVVSALNAGSAVITATASNGIVGTYPVNVEERFVEAIEIETDDILQISLGQEQVLNAIVIPDNASYPEVTWYSSDTDVVEVSDLGVISAKSCGTATVSAISSNGLQDDITVQVNEIRAEKLEIQGESQITIGENSVLHAVFDPVDTTDQSVKWSVMDERIATIDQNGNIKALQVGCTTVTVVGKDAAAEIEIEVLPIDVERIEITSDAGTSLDKGETAQLSAIVYPADATYSNITWSTSDPSIATIDENGLLCANESGTVVITAIAEDGCTATLEMTVLLSNGAVLAILGIPVAIIAGGTVAVTKKIRKKRRANRSH